MLTNPIMYATLRRLYFSSYYVICYNSAFQVEIAACEHDLLKDSFPITFFSNLSDFPYKSPADVGWEVLESKRLPILMMVYGRRKQSLTNSFPTTMMYHRRSQVKNMFVGVVVLICGHDSHMWQYMWCGLIMRCHNLYQHFLSFLASPR